MSKLLPALVAVSGGLAAAPAIALELGDLKVNSTLGQPLRASIAYALAPNEQLDSTCVTLQQGSPGRVLPTVSRATISIADGVISLTGKTAVREPLLTTRVNINCPYTARLSREYLLFVDPPGTAPVSVSAPAVSTAMAVRQPSPTPVRRQPVNTTQIGSFSSYQVQPGDSLSVIAQRIENRPIGLWDAVTAIFDANPDAFIDNDPNRLKAGSWLSIPDFGNTQPAMDNIAGASELPSGESLASDRAVAYPGVEAGYTAAETAPSAAPTAVAEPEIAQTGAAFGELKPGDVFLDTDNPFVTPGGSSSEVTTIIDTPLDSPAIAASPNGPTISMQTPATATSSWNWLLWLAGSGIAIIAALLLFGRLFGGRAKPIGAVAMQPARRQSDCDTEQIEAVSGLDFDLLDDSPTDENLSLDVDFVAGTGLTHGDGVHVEEDFGFAASAELDMELPEEMGSGWQSSPTDVNPQLPIEAQSPLDSEVLPTDDDYDMSVLIDATKMTLPDEVTERDLMAVAIDTGDTTLTRDGNTVSSAVDFHILEQDYEDELSATQILNLEIAKAAAELDDRLDMESGDKTIETPLATVTEIDVTAQLPASKENVSDLDDTDIKAGQSAEFLTDDNTAMMPANDSDLTVEMDVKPDKVDTKSS